MFWKVFKVRERKKKTNTFIWSICNRRRERWMDAFSDGWGNGRSVHHNACDVISPKSDIERERERHGEEDRRGREREKQTHTERERETSVRPDRQTESERERHGERETGMNVHTESCKFPWPCFPIHHRHL